MNEELKKCPSCGPTGEYEFDPIRELDPEFDPEFDTHQSARIACPICGMNTGWVDPGEEYSPEHIWNRRPIEDALRARIAELEGALRRLRDATKYWETQPRVSAAWLNHIANKALEGK